MMEQLETERQTYPTNLRVKTLNLYFPRVMRNTELHAEDPDIQPWTALDGFKQKSIQCKNNSGGLRSPSTFNSLGKREDYFGDVILYAQCSDFSILFWSATAEGRIRGSERPSKLLCWLVFILFSRKCENK